MLSIYFLIPFRGITAIFPVCFTETLKMHDLTCPEKTDGSGHIGILDGSQDIFVGAPGFLFCCHIFRQIRNDIALGLVFTGIVRDSARRLRPKRGGVVDIIGTETGVFDFLHGQILCKLIDDGSDHLKVGEFFRTCIVLGNVPN